MEKAKYMFKWGFTWNIKKLEKWMSGLSAKGVHIEKPGNLWNRAATDPSKQYEYRMDFQRLLNKEKFKEYIALYADGDWEYIGSVGPFWHYYRKDVHSQQPFELYTDQFSLIEYYKRIRVTILIIAIANFLSFLLNTWNIAEDFTAIWYPILTIQIILVITLIYGYWGYGQKIKQLQRDSLPK